MAEDEPRKNWAVWCFATISISTACKDSYSLIDLVLLYLVVYLCLVYRGLLFSPRINIKHVVTKFFCVLEVIIQPLLAPFPGGGELYDQW